MPHRMRPTENVIEIVPVLMADEAGITALMMLAVFASAVVTLIDAETPAIVALLICPFDPADADTQITTSRSRVESPSGKSVKVYVVRSLVF